MTAEVIEAPVVIPDDVKGLSKDTTDLTARYAHLAEPWAGPAPEQAYVFWDRQAEEQFELDLDERTARNRAAVVDQTAAALVRATENLRVITHPGVLARTAVLEVVHDDRDEAQAESTRALARWAAAPVSDGDTPEGDCA